MEQVGLGARAVVVGRRALDAGLGQRPQQRQDRRHARAAADEQQPAGRTRPQREDAVGPGDLQLVAGLDRAVAEQAGEAAARVELDHELELARLGGECWPSRTSGARRRGRGSGCRRTGPA